MMCFMRVVEKALTNSPKSKCTANSNCYVLVQQTSKCKASKSGRLLSKTSGLVALVMYQSACCISCIMDSGSEQRQQAVIGIICLQALLELLMLWQDAACTDVLLYVHSLQDKCFFNTCRSAAMA